MRVLVTGANGLLGQKLVGLLSDKQNVELIATGRGANRTPGSGYSYFSCDLTSAEEVSGLLVKFKPEVIIHTAAMTQVDQCEQYKDDCWAANVHGTQHLIDGCKVTKAFFLYVSTDFVFDGTAGPYAENDAPNPVNFYGESKWEAERIVKDSGLPWAIARTVLVYGVAHDMSRSNIVLWVKKSLEEGKPISVVNDQWRTPTLVEDLTLGCFEIVRKRKTGVFHLSGEVGMTPYELAVRVADFFRLDKSLITPVDQSTFSQPGKRPPRTGFNIQKAKKELGFRPRGFEEGLKVLSSQL